MIVDLNIRRLWVLLFIPFSFLFFSFPVFSVDKPPSIDHEPGSRSDILKVADTSSPRDTLFHFIQDLETAVRHIDPDTRGVDEIGYRAYRRTVSMLDFRTTPGGNSRVIIGERLAMLYDVLSRIDLPPYDQIPGKDQTVNGEINQWTIPNTNISIKRKEAGQRKGEFLFSAQTVLYTPQHYRETKNIDPKQSFIPDVYNKLITGSDSRMKRGYLMRNSLRPVDNSSPQALLQSFMKDVNDAYAVIMKTDKALKQRPPEISMEDAKRSEVHANNLLKAAMLSFDLTRVPKNIRNDVALETTLQFKEILDRILLPPLEMIPDLAEVIFKRENAEDKVPGGIHWRIPDTPIEIVQITEGEQAGNFIISSDSVARLPRLYEKIKDFPYRDDFTNIAVDYDSPGLSKGFYEYYISTPGNLIPGTTFLGRVVDRLPSWTKGIYYGQALWQYCFLILSVGLGGIFLFFCRRLIVKKSTRTSPAGKFWSRALFNLLTIFVFLLLLDFLDNRVNLTGALLASLDTAFSAVYWAMYATLLFFLGMALAESIISSPKIDPEGVQASYIRAVLGVVSFIVMVSVFVYGLAHIGVALGPLLASLGIGGLAVALAVRPTLENIIGSFMIFIDKPFRVGQRVNVLGQDGTIESIGLRSTKVRLLTGPLTSIPNKKLVDIEVENIGRRPYIRRNFSVSITYDTPPEKIVRAVDIIREILSVPDNDAGASTADAPHPNEAVNAEDFPPRVYFNDMLADSLNIVVFYWYHPAEYWDFLEHSNWVNLKIIEQFNNEGIDFAFPTQTLHLAGDENKPLKVDQKWEETEGSLSPSTILAQASAQDAQALLSQPSAASDTVRPDSAFTPKSKKAKVEGELTEAPVEDDALGGDGQGNQR